MLYFIWGFITAIVVFGVAAGLAMLDEHKGKGADDVFRVYYFKDDGRSNKFPQCLKTNKYEKEIRGAMAEDVYIWLTGKKGGTDDGETLS